MRLITTLLLLWPVAAFGQQPLVFGSKVEGSLAAGETRAFVFQADGGDLVSGQAELNGPEGWVRFVDGAGRQVGARVQSFFMAGNGARRVGFVAPSNGSYQLRFSATGPLPARFSLVLERRGVEERMRSVNTLAKDVSSSPRIRELTQDVVGGHADAVAGFWKERAGNGPVVESIPNNAQEMLVTFLWRETFATRNVLVGWPMAAFRNDDYFMSHLAGTDVWYKTIQLRRGTRVQYTLSPNVAEPSDRLFTDRLDPLNPRRFPTDPGFQGDLASVLELPGAPDDSWAVRIPVLRGAIEHTTFKSTLLGNQRDSWIYTPPGFDRTKGPYRLAVIFDGFAYVNAGWVNAPQTLDNLINDGKIPPVVVCFLNSTVNRLVEFGYAGAAQLGDALVRELLPDLRERYGVSATSGNVLIGGSSAGGLAAALIALEHPETFGSVLSQSGAFRLRKDGTDEPNTIAQIYAAAARAPIRFYLETGLYENVPSAALPLHESALDEGITASNRHFRDVLVAKGYAVTYRETAGAHENIHWSAMLADGLINLLGSK